MAALLRVGLVAALLTSAVVLSESIPRLRKKTTKNAKASSTVKAKPVGISPSDPSIYYSPYAWLVSPSNATCV